MSIQPNRQKTLSHRVLFSKPNSHTFTIGFWSQKLKVHGTTKAFSRMSLKCSVYRCKTVFCWALYASGLPETQHSLSSAQSITAEWKEKLQTEWSSMVNDLSLPLPHPMADSNNSVWVATVLQLELSIFLSMVPEPLGGHAKHLLGLRRLLTDWSWLDWRYFWTKKTESRIPLILKQGSCFCPFVSLKSKNKNRKPRAVMKTAVPLSPCSASGSGISKQKHLSR